MAENYKFLYEQMKNIVTKYQDDIVPGYRKQLEKVEHERDVAVECINEIEYQNRKNSENWIDDVIEEYRKKLEDFYEDEKE